MPSGRKSWRRNTFAKALAEQLRIQSLGDTRGPEAGASTSNSLRLTASPSSSCLPTRLTVPSSSALKAEGSRPAIPLGPTRLGFGCHLAPVQAL
ncbi:uncharacterized protein GLRG_05795 [Colletotrichum graminicola M1.001]|uniref:Uncharacterized protein n=1 Tax=Colletotrichum graminicola (strain M1.001 / M2 / FGSC 10212) TaxID=645133 RepID=E3QIP1_COLGM|nr:uncharacterized protein GLRG_05795 [Colletotrichum graminicola M1.001]EFQ30651.1 hypothetical protein GLRG_05795 [Colletotrichum graminicola M1.001]